MGLFVRCRLSTLALVAIAATLALGCQNGRKPRGRSSQYQAAPLAPALPPSAFLTVSPNVPYVTRNFVEASVGDAIQFRWNGENADLLRSYFTMDAQDGCGGGTTGPIGWVANTLTGTTTMTTLACQAGRTYTYYYESKDSPSGKVSQGIAMVHVIAPVGAPAQGLLRVTQIDSLNNDLSNPPIGIVEVNPGDSIKVYWDGQGGSATLAETSVDSADTCGANTLSFPEVQTGTVGNVTRQIRACAAGHTYSTNFKVTRAGTTAIESRMIVRVRNNPALAAPTASLTANGNSGNVEVTAGQTLTFDWSSTNADQGDSTVTMTSEPGAILCDDDLLRGTQATSWDALGPIGNVPQFMVPDCKSKHTFTINFTAYQTQTGKSATTTLTLKVNPRPGT